MSTTHTTPAGVTLRVVDALHGPQQTFTRDQVAYLISLAYQAGRRHAAADDLAEMVGCWQEYAEAPRTREQRVADRMAEMDRLARIRAAREGRPYRIHPGGPVDWDTGRPVRRLEAAA